MDNVFKVNVTRGLSLWHATTSRGKVSLCDFNRGLDPTLWIFRLPAGFPETRLSITSEHFPMEYFKSLCQSVLLLAGFTTEPPVIELTAQARNALGLKY